MKIAVIIPAVNEEQSIGKVLSDIPWDHVNEVIVVDNGSDDNTINEARKHRTTVLEEPKSGYGHACLRGINYLRNSQEKPDIVVFIDGDYSDYPEEMVTLIKPIKEAGVDMVIGSRALGERASGSMTPQQIFGNWLATSLMRWLYGASFTDLGPFRAIKFDSLVALNMVDTTYGWTVEMQIKAAKQNLSYTEVPVSYRKRIGKSKISGTIKGTIGAGYKILTTIAKYR
ncbi:MAG: glycosyltransferase family 2 protein [Flavobacteriales bacterium]|nr:glycosyltransferase family 2 protein [Flavobacteriales bacterium]